MGDMGKLGSLRNMSVVLRTSPPLVIPSYTTSYPTSTPYANKACMC